MTPEELEACTCFGTRTTPGDQKGCPVHNCFWEEPENDYPTSGCGKSFSFNDDGPVENGFKFCPFCGKTLQVNKT